MLKATYTHSLTHQSHTTHTLTRHTNTHHTHTHTPYKHTHSHTHSHHTHHTHSHATQTHTHTHTQTHSLTHTETHTDMDTAHTHTHTPRGREGGRNKTTCNFWLQEEVELEHDRNLKEKDYLTLLKTYFSENSRPVVLTLSRCFQYGRRL